MKQDLRSCRDLRQPGVARIGVSARLRDIQVPTLVVVGEHDLPDAREGRCNHPLACVSSL